MEDIKNFLIQYPLLYDSVKFIGVLLLAMAVYFIVKKILIAGVHKLVKKTRTEIDDILVSDAILKRIAYVAPVLVIFQFLHLFPDVEDILKK